MAKPDRLYELLPVFVREQDASQNFPLRALLRIVASQVDLVEDDIRRLYDDLFIETCRPWVIPYIGDLVSNRLLFDGSRTNAALAESLFDDLQGPNLRPAIAIRTRADVAKTIYYRRRKGTLPMLEELARDVTGWPAHAVEFFELLGWTQFREHFRPQSHWVDVRNVDRMDRIGRAYDETSHTVDVRRPVSNEGWHNIRNIGFFLFRLGSYPLQFVPARQASAPWRYHFSPLGNPAPLFSLWRREGDEAGLASELQIASPIRRPFFYEDLQRYRNLNAPPARPDFTDLYGLPVPLPGPPIGLAPESSLFIVRNGEPVLPAQNPNAPPAIFQPRIVCRDLDPWPATQPAGSIIAVDVERGRLAVGSGWPDNTDTIDVFYHYGFSADMGSGPYERQKWLLRPGLASVELFVREGTPSGTPNTFATLTDALTEWAGAAVARRDTVITILDSRTYALPPTIILTNENFLVIQAANGQRPLLQANASQLEVDASAPVSAGDPDRRAALTLSGVVLEGHVHITGDLGRLRLLHATLIPGRSLDDDGNPATNQPSIVADAGPANAPLNAQLRIEIAFSILGAIFAPEYGAGIWLLDSIVDAAGAATAIGSAVLRAPALITERSTFFGELWLRQLQMSECITSGRIDVSRTQEGCARFSYVLPGSRTPRRYRCQPDLGVSAAVAKALEHNPALTAAQRAQVRASIEAGLVPSFTSTRYGRPEYAQLRLNAPIEIRAGAEDGSEMGAFCNLKQPQRESNLRLRLEEYLPFGLTPGIIYAT
jgi:hypothetical protein